MAPPKEVSRVDLIGTVVRFIVSALVLMFVGFIVPGFSPLTFWHALLAALVIAALGWIIEATMGQESVAFRAGRCRLYHRRAGHLGDPIFRARHERHAVGRLWQRSSSASSDLFVPTAITR